MGFPEPGGRISCLHAKAATSARQTCPELRSWSRTLRPNQRRRGNRPDAGYAPDFGEVRSRGPELGGTSAGDSGAIRSCALTKARVRGRIRSLLLSGHVGSNQSRRVRDQAELDAFETLITAQRAEEPLPRGRLGYAHYRAIHRHLFQDVFSWAGKLRSIRIAKGGNMFCYPEQIDREMRQLFAELGRAASSGGFHRRNSRHKPHICSLV